VPVLIGLILISPRAQSIRNFLLGFDQNLRMLKSARLLEGDYGKNNPVMMKPEMFDSQKILSL